MNSGTSLTEMVCSTRRFVQTSMTSPPDWLQILCGGLERLGNQVVACRSTCDQTLLRLGSQSTDDDRPLEIHLSRSEEAPYFAEVSGLYIRYRGAENLNDNQQKALTVVQKLVAKLAPRIPEDLDSPYLRGIKQMADHQAIAFAFPFCTAERSTRDIGTSPSITEVLVRMTGRCNQKCPFCSAPPPGGEPSIAVLNRLLDALCTVAPKATMTLTGGEPTLRKDLPEFVERALGASKDLIIEVQTNAVRLADMERAKQYRPSPRLRFFISLHSMDPEVYDQCTGTKGMLDRALQGISNLQELGHKIILSYVANQWNAPKMVDWVEKVAAKFTHENTLAIHFSIMMCPEHRPGATDILVRYEDLANYLEKAYEKSVELGLDPEPLLSSSHAAIPACFLSEKYHQENVQSFVVESQRQDEGNFAEGWVKSPECSQCCMTGRCFGVPKGYADHFGIDSLKPIHTR